jgi:hypothetical protein
MPQENNHRTISRSALIILASAASVFFLSIFFLVHTYRTLSHQGFFGPPFRQRLHQRQIAVDAIQDWMTFRYVNNAFNLPPDYLKSNLSITDKKYPDITINKWANDSKQDKTVLLERIKTLIQDRTNVLLPPMPPTIQ